jgi:hypothetical protein
MDTLREVLVRDWVAQQKAAAREAFFAALRERYTLTGAGMESIGE